ncbi:AAA family ATPase [Streptococcus rifensis]
MLLGLQGGMAVGKTSIIQFIQDHSSTIRAVAEDNREVIEQLNRQQLDKTVYEDYLEIQRYWIAHEIERFRRLQDYPYHLIDWGAEEIAFYTLHYPKSIGKDWDIEQALAPELAALKACYPERVLYLDAMPETLLARKTGDVTRKRSFFDHYTNKLLPYKKEWLMSQLTVDTLTVDNLTAEEMGLAVLKWTEDHFQINRKA